QKNNGECLSDQYYDAHTKLLWRCKNFHIWEAPPLTILRGSWCRYCAGTAKLNIEIAKQIAFSRQGQCLSVEYKNISTPLLWACQYNHQW
ncbi:18889_t:CDS:1, partial [Funneliformis geosporum]